MAIDHIIDIIQPFPGIQRDGTAFSSRSSIDAQWCRWYRGYAKKMGGYTLMSPGTPEIIRNLYKIPKQKSFDTYVGRPSSLTVINANPAGIANPETDRTPTDNTPETGFVANPDNMWTFDRYNNFALSVTLNLVNNPLSTVTGSNTVTVRVSDSSSFVNGETINMQHAVLTGGLTIVQLNVSKPVTIVDATHVSYEVGGDAATATVVAGGGNNVTLAYKPSFSHVIAHAAPNLEDINSNVQTNIFWGNINSNAPLVLIDPVNLPICSGGVIVAYPYIFIYGNNGIVSYTLTPNDWSTAVNAAIASPKIVKAVKTRGGGNTPSILFFSLDSLHRATFQGGDPPFKFDTIQEGISIISQNCVVTDFNVVYWIGVNQFYLYNGVVRPLQNDMNRLYFFENLNQKYRNKVFGWFNHLYDEIWWHYPSKGSTECDSVIIFNLKEERWYDSILHRSAVSPPSDPFAYPILADSEARLNKYLPPTQCYGIWQHETEPKNMVLYGESFAIRSYFETNIFTLFDKNPAQDRNLRVRRIEPDFKQSGNLSLTVNHRSFAQGTIYSSESYVFPAGPVEAELAKADTVEMGRLVSFRFESNEVNGDFEAGKILLNYSPGDVRP